MYVYCRREEVGVCPRYPDVGLLRVSGHTGVMSSSDTPVIVSHAATCSSYTVANLISMKLCLFFSPPFFFRCRVWEAVD